MFTTRLAIACVLIFAGFAVRGHAQSAPSKDEPTASISGKVTFRGEGVAGVIISLRSNENRLPGTVADFRGVTDANGEYEIANVRAGKYIVMPIATALVESSRERTLIVNEGQTIEDVDFSLIRGGVITGRVLDQDGRPVIEEEVQLFSMSGTVRTPFWPAAMTDDRGIYRIFALKPGSYIVAAGREDVGQTGRAPRAYYLQTFYPNVTDREQAKVIEVSDGSEATNVDITLGSSLTMHTASGVIVDGETGQPLANVPYGAVHFLNSNKTSYVYRGTATNSRGEFRLENLVAGTYAVSIGSGGEIDLRAEEVKFEIVDQDVTGLVVKSIKGGSVSGVVVLEGAVDAAIREQLRNGKLIIFVRPGTAPAGSGLGFRANLNPNGTFRAVGLPAGTASFSLSASPRFRIVRIEREGLIKPRGIEVKLGEDIKGIRVVLGYADGSIRGTVEIENGPLPPNGRLQVRVGQLTAANTSGGFSPLQVDARGQFVADNLFPGTYEVIAEVFVPSSRVPIAQQSQQVVVTSGSPTNTTIKLDLNPPRPIP